MFTNILVIVIYQCYKAPKINILCDKSHTKVVNLFLMTDVEWREVYVIYIVTALNSRRTYSR